jgi:hypothetical protein
LTSGLRPLLQRKGGGPVGADATAATMAAVTTINCGGTASNKIYPSISRFKKSHLLQVEKE